MSRRDKSRTGRVGIIEDRPGISQWLIKMKQITNSSQIAPSDDRLRNIVATRSRTLLDTVQGQLRTSKPEKQNMNLIAFLLQVS